MEEQSIMFSCKWTWLTCRLQSLYILKHMVWPEFDPLWEHGKVHIAHCPVQWGSDLNFPWFTSFVTGTWDPVICGSNQSSSCGFQFSLILTRTFLLFFLSSSCSIEHYLLSCGLETGRSNVVMHQNCPCLFQAALGRQYGAWANVIFCMVFTDLAVGNRKIVITANCRHLLRSVVIPLPV